MKNIIKYVCIAMIAISGYELFTDISTLVRVGFVDHYVFTLPLISHIAMFTVGVLGLKFREEDERQKMLLGISGLQLILCLLAIFVGRYSLWIALKTLGIGDWLSIVCSVILLVYYIKSAIGVKRRNLNE
ncbi:MAG: hypothetical protein IJD70_03940 [Clostridia bacterium]|nr:hypothetical protein [Clostridia bacterium]